MVSNEDKEKFLKELEETGNILLACKRSGVGRASVYRWLEDDPEFKKKYRIAMRRGRDLGTDFAESAIIKMIREGHFGAAKFFLEANSRRYYKPRKPIEAPKEPPRQLHTVEIRVVDPNRPREEVFDDHQRELAEAEAARRAETQDRFDDRLGH